MTVHVTEAAEFEGIYNLGVTHSPKFKVNRTDHNDQIYITKKEKYDAILKLVEERYEKTTDLIGLHLLKI